MKTIRTMLISTALLACTSLFANPNINVPSEVKAKNSDRNTADKVDNVKKGMNKTRTVSENSRENTENFAPDHEQPDKDGHGSHPSNMDINGKTHAELGALIQDE
jgi:hypothetical protein